eukprot:m.210710 g.210710  ORF g.210710 m.210710 type:complete len:67 (+) comp13782_c0_seq3:5129-5329(+)
MRKWSKWALGKKDTWPSSPFGTQQTTNNNKTRFILYVVLPFEEEQFIFMNMGMCVHCTQWLINQQI